MSKEKKKVSLLDKWFKKSEKNMEILGRYLKTRDITEIKKEVEKKKKSR